MSISSISNGTLAAPALYGLSVATQRIQDSTARLATNNRLINASDDVAAMSASTRLQSQLTAMRQAISNNTQADSFLQIAYDGLSQIGDILDSMNALAVQSSSASYTAADRIGFDLQFQEYAAQIDSIASGTSFGSIKLLDGSISGDYDVSTNSSAATKATGALNFAVNIGAGQTVVINRTTFTEGVNFSAAGTIAGTLDNLVTALSNSTNTAVSSATYQRSGNSINITYDAGGASGNQFLINQATSTAAFTTAGTITNAANVYTLQGASNNGLFVNGTRASGTIGDSLITTQSQTSASVRLTLTGAVAAGQQIRIDNGNGGTVNFSFSAAPVASTDIGIGATTQETMANALAVISRYTGTDDYGVRQLEITRDDDDLIFTSKTVGNPVDIPNAVLDISETMANGALSAATFNNGTNTGVNVQGVTNSAFVGTVSGFSATYVGADSLTASITVGSETYTAAITDTTPAANTTARFNSTSGGFFDVQLATAGGMSVGNQAQADTYAARLDAAFSTLTFSQTRPATSFTAAGALAGASAEFRLQDFSDVKVDDIQVYAPPSAGQDAVIDITVNGDVFRSQLGVRSSIGDYEPIVFTNLNNGNEQIVLRNGSVTQDLSTQTLADSFETALKNAFGWGNGNQAVTFQIGENSTDTLRVSIGDASTNRIFGGLTPDVLTQGNATTAQATIAAAKDEITGMMAEVGAAQSRVGYANDYLSLASTSVDAARGALADTDIAYESTQLALAQVMAQTSIAVLAQTFTLSNSLLSLVEVRG